MSKARRASVEIVYDGTNVTRFIQGYVKSMSYSDPASGESDSASLSMHDINKEWVAWIPKKGTRFEVTGHFEDWDQDGNKWDLYCGSFEADDVSVSGPPREIKLSGTSVPKNEAFNCEKRNKTWEEVTVKELAGEVAQRAGIELYYEADTIQIKAMEQDGQTDSAFLSEVCKKYGLAMKVFADKIIIFDEAAYENRPPVAEMGEKDFVSWNYNTTMTGTYTGARISYCDPATGEDHIVTVGDGPRLLEINEEADSAEDARKKAIAALNNENKKAVTMSVTIKAKEGIVSTACIRITGMGEPDGIYYIDKVTTKIAGSGASQQSLTMHKTGYRMDDAKVLLDPAEKVAEGGTAGDYTVVKGDTLWGIAKQYYNSPLGYVKIYEANKEVIEEAAKGRGRKDSANGHWIFPGTVLIIPKETERGA